MARYNPKNKQHRKSLAARITKMLVSGGFSFDPSSKVEDVYERPVAGTTARVRVFTSIVKGEMRMKDADAIRVCAVLDTNGSPRGLVKSTRINRTGDTDGITARLLDTLRKTDRTAQKRANDPGFLALPVKASKKRWVPKAKKAGSKRKTAPKTAKRINAALKASDKRIDAALKAKADADLSLSSLAFTVGQLVEFRTGMHKGMVKAVSKATITVFWFHEATTSKVTPLDIRALMAA